MPPGYPANAPPLPTGIICCGAGPPNPRTGPANPDGADEMTADGAPKEGTGKMGMPRPAGAAAPGGGCWVRWVRTVALGLGGGFWWADTETTVSPRMRTRPNDRRCSITSDSSEGEEEVEGGVGVAAVELAVPSLPCVGLVVLVVVDFVLVMVRTSSQSERTRFMWRSNASREPMMVRPSPSTTRMRHCR